MKRAHPDRLYACELRFSQWLRETYGLRLQRAQVEQWKRSVLRVGAPTEAYRRALGELCDPGLAEAIAASERRTAG